MDNIYRYIGTEELTIHIHSTPYGVMYVVRWMYPLGELVLTKTSTRLPGEDQLQTSNALSPPESAIASFF